MHRGLQTMLRERGDRVELGAADEQKNAKGGSVEAWARSSDNRGGGRTAPRFGRDVPKRHRAWAGWAQIVLDDPSGNPIELFQPRD